MLERLCNFFTSIRDDATTFVRGQLSEGEVDLAVSVANYAHRYLVACQQTSESPEAQLEALDRLSQSLKRSKDCLDRSMGLSRRFVSRIWRPTQAETSLAQVEASVDARIAELRQQEALIWKQASWMERHLGATRLGARLGIRDGSKGAGPYMELRKERKALETFQKKFAEGLAPLHQKYLRETIYALKRGEQVAKKVWLMEQQGSFAGQAAREKDLYHAMARTLREVTGPVILPNPEGGYLVIERVQANPVQDDERLCSALGDPTQFQLASLKGLGEFTKGCLGSDLAYLIDGYRGNEKLNKKGIRLVDDRVQDELASVRQQISLLLNRIRETKAQTNFDYVNQKRAELQGRVQGASDAFWGSLGGVAVGTMFLLAKGLDLEPEQMEYQQALIDAQQELEDFEQSVRRFEYSPMVAQYRLPILEGDLESKVHELSIAELNADVCHRLRLVADRIA